MKKIKLTKIKNFFKKTTRALAQKAFLTFFVLLLFALFLGGVVFYFYVISIETFDEIEPEKETAFRLDENAYQKIFNQWQIRDKKFLEVDLKEYPDIFR